MTSSQTARPRRPRARAETSIGSRESLYKALVESSLDSAFVFDASSSIELAVNRDSWLPDDCFIEAGGRPEDEASRVLRTAVARVLATGRDETHELAAPGPRAAQRFYRARFKRHENEDGARKVLVFVSDVTEQHETEEELRTTVRALEESRQHVLQAQKLESIGRLAGGVAHDFNNLLTAIISFSRFVMDDLAPGDPRRADLTEVLRAADSASRLTSQLLAFSRKRPVEPSLIEINAAVQRISAVLRRTLEAPIELRIVDHPEPVPVMFDPGQFDQLLMNLAVNARDAMPEGGTLSVEVGRRALHGHDELPDGDYATLSVADTGIGMSDEVLAQIFEPFFSTKGELGTGLGLATCYGIVKQAKGDIEVKSRPHQGACFTVLLPMCQTAAVPARDPGETDSEPARRLDGLALVVEDQPAIRRTMMRSLQSMGLHVLEAGTAEEALSTVRELDARVDLLVTDVVLPGRSGLELASELRERQPGLRVLVCSGYVGKDRDAELMPDERTAFLAKPFTGLQLSSKASGLFI